MRRRRRPEPGYIPIGQRVMRMLVWIFALLAAATVFYLVMKWKQPY